MASQPRRGGVKFVLLHHGACPGDGFHYRIAADGRVRAELDEAERGQHPRSIGVVIDGDFDVDTPADAQIDALKRLLLTLKLRYPDVQLGGASTGSRRRADNVPGAAVPHEGSRGVVARRVASPTTGRADARFRVAVLEDLMLRDAGREARIPSGGRFLLAPPPSEPRVLLLLFRRCVLEVAPIVRSVLVPAHVVVSADQARELGRVAIDHLLGDVPLVALLGLQGGGGSGSW